MIVRYKPYRSACVSLRYPRQAELLAIERTWRPWHRRSPNPPESIPWPEIGRWIRRASEVNHRIQPYSGNGAALPWCCYCGRPLTQRTAARDGAHRGTDATREHLVPRSMVPGHLRNPEDVLPDCCRDCNSKRGSLPLLRFLLRHPLMWRSQPPPVSVAAASPHQFSNAASAGIRCNTPRLPGVRIDLKGTP